MRALVIGCGSIGSRHARNLVALGHSPVLFDADIQKAGALWHEIGTGGAYSDLRAALLVEKPDAVLICTPAATHADVAAQLRLEGYAGPLFVEKPLGLSVAECEVFRSWPHQTTMVGYMLRFHPIVRAMKQMHPEHFRLRMQCDMRKWPGQFYAPAMYELSHEIDLALHFGATEWTPDKYHAGCVDTNLGYVELDGYCGHYDRTWMVTTQGGSIEASFSQPEAVGTEMYRDELAHFLSCVEQHIPTITPFTDGIRVVQVCEAAMQLAKEHA